MRILITGSKGLIGSALTKNLRSLGISVHCLDINEPEGPEHGDILDAALMEALAENCNGIVHLAAVSRVITGEKNPELCWKTNVVATKGIIEAALKSSRKPWLLYASSREVYGQPNLLPAKESFPLQPVNIYGRSKAEAEKNVLEARKKGLKSAVVRYSNVYGSIHDHPDRVVPAFCRSAAEGGELHVEGRDNLFDFTHLEDTIRGTLSLISLIESENHKLPPIHLTTGRPTSLQQAAELAVKASGSGARILEAASRHFDVAKFYGDASLAKKILGWQSSITIEQGIERLVKDFQNR